MLDIHHLRLRRRSAVPRSTIPRPRTIISMLSKQPSKEPFASLLRWGRRLAVASTTIRRLRIWAATAIVGIRSLIVIISVLIGRRRARVVVGSVALLGWGWVRGWRVLLLSGRRGRWPQRVRPCRNRRRRTSVYVEPEQMRMLDALQAYDK